MAITVHEVPKWLVIDGIGHAVSCIISGWHHTACGTITPNGKTEDTLPARVCRKCRAELKSAFVTSITQTQLK